MALLTVNGIARAGADPDLKFAPSGVAVCRLRAVASRNKKQDNGEWETTHEMWFDVTAFRELAEYVAENITKGQQFHLLGEIYEEEWTNDQGEKRKAVKVFASAIAPIKRREESGSQQRQQQGGSQWGNQPQGDPWASPVGQADEPPFLLPNENPRFF